MAKFDELTDQAAVAVLRSVGRYWLQNRGVEAFSAYEGARTKTQESFEHLPSWAVRVESGGETPGDFARKILTVLAESEDQEVRHWTSVALKEVREAKGQVLDPLTLSIGGAILVAAILAARVRKIGSVEFYEDIPPSLAKVLKAGASIIVPGS